MARLFLLSVLMVFLTPGDAAACSCSGPHTALQAVGADAIFQGRVVRIQPRVGYMGYLSREVEFVVTRVWRGEVYDRTVVLTGWGAGDCGLDVYHGVEYVVPAYLTDDGELASGACSGVQSVEDASATLVALGRSDRPMTMTPGIGLGWGTFFKVHALLSLLLLVMILSEFRARRHARM